MKIKYQFVNETVEIEVSKEWNAVIAELERKEHNNNQTQTRRHCSLDAFDQETEFSAESDTFMDYMRSEEFKTVYECLAQLSERHRRLLESVYMDGISLTEIARLEGRSVPAVHYALETARKKFKKVLEKALKNRDSLS